MTAPIRDSALSLGAVAILAMCIVTTAHEAIGHGSACAALGGHITQLNSSVFRCDLRSRWISPAGPLMNLVLGGAALAMRSRRTHGPTLHLLLIYLTAFAWFWEAAYCMQAMLKGEGDLYFTGIDFIGEPQLPWRITGGILGLGLYLTTVRVTTQGLQTFFGSLNRARRAARWAWLAATGGAALAAATYRSSDLRSLHDAVLEIGAASIPLLWLHAVEVKTTPMQPPAYASRGVLVVAAVAYAFFVMTLGRGIGAVT